jgi:pyruvate formate lyase activating enzyme
MTTGIIFDIKRFAIHDGPGIRTTVFLKGCPLSCWWCHNPESQSTRPILHQRETECVLCGACVTVCPEKARSIPAGTVERNDDLCLLCGTCADFCPAEAIDMIGRRKCVDEVVAEIAKDIPFHDESGGGVTFSGGEPLAQPEFLLLMLERCRDLDIHTAVDTCGYARPELLERVAEKTDLFLFDLKFMDNRRHHELTGVGNELILGNLHRLSLKDKDIHIRVPVIPGITDTEENLNAIGRFVSSLPNKPPVTLLPHHATAMGKYARFGINHRLPAETAVPSDETMGNHALRLNGYGLEVSY